MNLYLFTAEVPRKYIDVVCSSESGADAVEFWGAVTSIIYEEWSVENIEITDFGILKLAGCSDEMAIEFYLGDRNSIIADFEVSIPESVNEDDVGEWIEDKLPGDWHVDEIVKQTEI